MTTWEKVKGENGTVLRIMSGILQGLVIAALMWVGNKTADSAEKVAGLTAQVQALEKQVGRIQNAEDARQAEIRRQEFRGIAEERRR